MSKRIHRATVRDRRILLSDGSSIVAGTRSVDAVRLTLESPADWAGLDLQVNFASGSGSVGVEWDGVSDVTVPAGCVASGPDWLGVTLVGRLGEAIVQSTEGMRYGIPVVPAGREPDTVVDGGVPASGFATDEEIDGYLFDGGGDPSGEDDEYATDEEIDDLF